MSKKQFGQLVGMMVQNMPEMTAEQMQKWIGNPKGLQAVLSGLSETVEAVTKVISFLVSTTKQTISSGRCDSETGLPTSDEKEVEFGLFHFKEKIMSDDVIAQMKKEGFRPATEFELGEYNNKKPEDNKLFPIIELGTSIKTGCLDATCLRRNGIYDAVSRYHDGGYGWDAYCRFLGVRITE